MSVANRDLIERAHNVDILAVAQRYNTQLKRAGSEYVGPCPVCGGRDRFSANTIKQIWNCRGCGQGGDVIALVQHLTGATFAEALERLTGETWPRREISERAQRLGAGGSNKGAEAGRLWRASVPIGSTVAEHYLVRVRGIDVEQIPDLDDALRFHSHCPFGCDELPCLIALVRDVISDEPKAIVRTALTADGRKLDRKALGPIGGGAIKLWPSASVTTGVAVGEGVETTAAAATRIEHKGSLLQPAWSLVDAGNLRTFPVLPGIETLTILVDNDPSGTGQEAARTCARRWREADREVLRLMPDQIGEDFNDIVR